LSQSNLRDQVCLPTSWDRVAQPDMAHKCRDFCLDLLYYLRCFVTILSGRLLVDFFQTDTTRTKLFISLRMFMTQHLNDLNIILFVGHQISRFRSSDRSNVARRHFNPRTIMAVPWEVHEVALSDPGIPFTGPCSLKVEGRDVIMYPMNSRKNKERASM
jgi:hypothetical protein